MQGGLLLFGVILLFAFGLAVPAVVLITNSASKASDATPPRQPDVLPLAANLA